MVTYQFEISDALWSQWKNTVPRSKSLDERIRELIEADRDGRIQPEDNPLETAYTGFDESNQPESRPDVPDSKPVSMDQGGDDSSGRSADNDLIVPENSKESETNETEQNDNADGEYEPPDHYVEEEAVEPEFDDRGGGPLDEVRDAVTHAVDTFADENWEDDPVRLQSRREAAAAVLERAVVIDDVLGRDTAEEYAEDYPVSNQKLDTWWRKTVRPVLNEYGSYEHGSHGYQVDVENLSE